jgi:archaellum component FlaC
MEEQFKRINDKLQRLVKQYQLLQKDNERLNQSLKNHMDSNAQQQQQIEALTQQVLILKSAAGQMEEADKKAFEKRINRYIKSIDKYITYLSD